MKVDDVLFKTIMILKSLALNYPILSEWGIDFPKMIVVVTAESAKLIGVLKNFKSDGKKNSDFRFFIHSNNDKISDFARSYSQNLADGVDTSMGFPIVITDNPIVDENTNDKFYIFVEDAISINHIEVDNLHLEPDELETIRKDLMKYEITSNSREELCLYAASCFIRDVDESDYFSTIKNLIERDQAARESGNFSSLCIEYLYKFQETERFSSIYHKSEAGSVSVSDSMFYDDQYLYIPEALFKAIIAPIRKHAPLYKIMEELVEDELLITDNSKGYTVKLNCGNLSGDRPRVLRLDAAKLTSPGKLGFIDICELTREE